MTGAVGAPELSFAVEDAAPLEFAAVPTLAFRLRVESGGAVPVAAVALNVQLGIALRRRSYDPATRARLTELLGAAGGDNGALRTLFWTKTTIMVPPFTGNTTFELPIVCTYDFETAVVKYLHALEDGEVPLEFLFSGTIYYRGEGGALNVGRIPWDREATYRLPIPVWRAVLERHYPDSAWLRLRRDTLERLHAYRARRLLPGWDDALDELLRLAEGGLVEPGNAEVSQWK